MYEYESTLPQVLVPGNVIEDYHMISNLQTYMKQYVSTVIKKLRDAKLFAPQGGPIILAQVLITK